MVGNFMLYLIVRLFHAVIEGKKLSLEGFWGKNVLLWQHKEGSQKATQQAHIDQSYTHVNGGGTIKKWNKKQKSYLLDSI